MNSMMLLPLVSLLAAGGSVVKVKSEGVNSKTLSTCLALVPFVVLGFVALAVSFVESQALVPVLLGTTCVLLIMMATVEINAEKPWAISAWIVYSPFLAILGLVILLSDGRTSFELMAMYAPTSLWPVFLVGASSLLLLVSGWRWLYGYLVAPAAAFIGERVELRPPWYIRAMVAAHRYSGFQRLDLRSEALQQAIERGEHHRAGQLASELEDWDSALQEYRNADDSLGQARALAELDYPHEAAQCYEKAGELAEAAHLYEECGIPAKAAPLYRRAGQDQAFVRICEDADLFSELAGYYETKHDHAKAAELYERAGELDRAATAYKRASHFEKAADLYLDLDNLDQAKKMYKRSGNVLDFYDALRQRNMTQKLEEIKAETLSSYKSAQEELNDGCHKTASKTLMNLVDEIGVFDPYDPMEQHMGSQIAWHAITFFEDEKSRDLQKAHRASLVLKGYLERASSPEPIEQLALSARIMLFESIHKNFDKVKSRAEDFLKALQEYDTEELDQQTVEFLSQMMWGTIQTLHAHGQKRLANDVTRRFRKAPIPLRSG